MADRKVKQILTPEGVMTVEQFMKTVSPERRAYFLTAIEKINRQRIEAQKLVDQQLKNTFDVPGIIYKYIPLGLLTKGCPNSLRSTQPPALNDVMECNIITLKNSRELDRDGWRVKLFEVLKRDGFPLQAEELKRRLNLYGDPRISTVIQDYLAEFVGVVSFSTDPLIQTMWAHYSQNSGFVVGYDSQIMRTLGVKLRKVLYMEIAPVYDPLKDNIIRLNFVDEEERMRKIREGDLSPGTPILDADANFVELRKDWRKLSSLLFVKGKSWEYEKEVRLLVEQRTTRTAGDKDGWPIKVLDIPKEAIKEVYVGFNTPREAIDTMYELVGRERRGWSLKYTSSHAYRMQVTTTSIN